MCALARWNHCNVDGLSMHASSCLCLSSLTVPLQCPLSAFLAGFWIHAFEAVLSMLSACNASGECQEATTTPRFSRGRGYCCLTRQICSPYLRACHAFCCLLACHLQVLPHLVTCIEPCLPTCLGVFKPCQGLCRMHTMPARVLLMPVAQPFSSVLCCLL